MLLLAFVFYTPMRCLVYDSVHFLLVDIPFNMRVGQQAACEMMIRFAGMGREGLFAYTNMLGARPQFREEIMSTGVH